MNLREEQRRARLLKSRAERLPQIKKQFEESQGRKDQTTVDAVTGVDQFEAVQNRNFNSNFAPGGKDAGLVGSKGANGKKASKGSKNASSNKKAAKQAKNPAKSAKKLEAEQRKVN